MALSDMFDTLSLDERHIQALLQSQNNGTILEVKGITKNKQHKLKVQVTKYFEHKEDKHFKQVTTTSATRTEYLTEY